MSGYRYTSKSKFNNFSHEPYGLYSTERDNDLLFSATIVMKSKSIYRVWSKQLGVINVQLAFSCLTVPEIDDEVLVYYENEEQSVILAVLKRCSNTAHLLTSDREIKILNDEFSIESKRFNLKIDSVDLAAKKMELDSKENQFKFDQLSVFGLSMNVAINSVRSVFSIFDQTIKQFLQKVKFSERKISEAEVVHAKAVNMKINNSFAIKSKQTNIQSSEYVNISSDLINMS
ncbi:hypothetical protein PsalN5692_02715 [Piscirickettsia salmonis]|uniref:DUF3540 domain-containing protein n=2 Tax=Piscirickettsia salmonis TaxID=1238 RepID=UPI0012BA0495|nr:DUF3540 domain-containing protein [Piscirickettsia salmonis]QGP51234.1 hypothetical protein PsalN5692_02715 [Piscirickettsia salmonis]QGP53562.1 hypothetical protein PsalSR1_00976 [Piscirickettsia salmonis]QGP60522.1 hypothetical protein PsalBI1_03137 [Piscirickettsia salmonis]QGP63133.1 hypothetical protein PsalMR5_00980 [Piscirickettsia salmonis]